MSALNPDSAASDLELMASKLTYLVCITVVSTLVLMALSPVTISLFSVDMVINGYCVYLSFGFASNHYDRYHLGHQQRISHLILQMQKWMCCCPCRIMMGICCFQSPEISFNDSTNDMTATRNTVTTTSV